MKPYNYVQETWEERFQIHRYRPSADRFAFGFIAGALLTGAVVLYGAASSSLGL